jgi:phosphoribosyl-AMP cyclohydrolase
MDEKARARAKKSLETGYVWRYSRQRKKLMTNGVTSGNRMKINDISPDCDSDVLSVDVIPEGLACHTGHDSCFYKRY